MEELKSLIEFLEVTRLFVFSRSLLLIIGGFFIARLASAAAIKFFPKALTAHSQLALKRSVFYVIWGLFVVSALRQLGFDLSLLLGAAGILTVAVGFASQTSASNLISGLFLMVERPFSIADVIRVGGTTGEVISIDLLSVKLRTFDNLFVRIPNETMIKSEVTTLTKFPIRRFDLLLGVAYRENISKVKEVLLEVADRNPLCLKEPDPLFIFQGFGDSSMDIQLSVWAQRENFLKLKNSIFEEVKLAFDEHGIEIPFPHLSLYAGSETDAIPVTMVEPRTPEASAEQKRDLN
ncbi:mechanosensitive ion channel family protein [Reinekea marinisedimentorum]|uniref:Small-conductance mechanosensitive channel n=1 Tax=Reinekea marinisedimentorum TaxID=230495 RepID=A0A4R3I8D7_9GAMM|nr:mechanosensitive ion channel family protein [Reinekea marinisedimentorum]TCS42523.1 small-conductance mechanosensitive channel [Reinekea marinisedimentorum]